MIRMALLEKLNDLQQPNHICKFQFARKQNPIIFYHLEMEGQSSGKQGQKVTLVQKAQVGITKKCSSLPQNPSISIHQLHNLPSKKNLYDW